jgi:hypothetical protein
MVMIWAGYSLTLFGWSLWRDYDVTLGQLASPLHPYSGPWPPPLIPAGQFWPAGQPAAGDGKAKAPAKKKTAAAGQ